MRSLLKLFLVLALGSITVSALLSEKVRFSKRPTFSSYTSRSRILTVFNHVASIQSENKYTLPVEGKTIHSSKESPNKTYSEINPVGPNSIEGLWRMIRNNGVRRVMKETIQKVLMFCTLSASLLLIGSQKALAAAAPLVKNVKVRRNGELSLIIDIFRFLLFDE